MTARQARTRPPKVPFDGRITRYLGARDDADDQPTCPECGSDARDLWADEGAVTLRFRCPECSETWEPEVSR